jgi:hypothetical protein
MSNSFFLGATDLAPFSGSAQAQVGAPGPANSASGNGYISQLFYVSACGTLSFYYRTYSEQPGYTTVSATISTQGGTQLASLYITQAMPGVTDWTLYSCTTCDGSCGGFSFAPYTGELLKLTFGASWSTFQGAQWIDNVCLQTSNDTTTTAGVTTTAPSGDVCFVNSGFETGSFSPGWTPIASYQSVTSAAYNAFTGLYDIYPQVGAYMGMAGYPGPGVPVTGTGQFRQTIAIPGCGYRFQFRYRMYSGFFGFNTIAVSAYNGGSLVAFFINTTPQQGWGNWVQYSCDLCSTCPADFTPYVGMNLNFFWGTSWYNSAPAAILVDEVCFTAIPTTVSTTIFTGTTTLYTGPTTTAITTTSTTTVAPTTSPYSCFTNSGFESGSFTPGWVARATYQSTPTAAYNVFTGSYSIFPFAGSRMGMAGFSGPGTISAGAGAFYQDMTIPQCGGTFTFKYRYYSGLFPWARVVARAINPLNSALYGSFFDLNAPSGWSGWATYSCTMCAGTCPFDFTPYVGQTVRFDFFTTWSNDSPGALLIDDVCFTS